MVTLDRSVITGKCVGCADYKVQVADLLAQLAAKDKTIAAAGVFVHRMMGWGGEHRPHPGACDHCAFDRILKGGER